ncbi:MAG: hypothetical protein CL930_10630 [Deltaproteobacteria bacterium]|nr:hypothetical protein [Deltaproteobacteria bacterium]
MGWFERQLNGREPEEFEKELGRYLRAAGVDKAFQRLCGPYGVRRFVIRFEKQGEQTRLTELETHALPFGGGPPDPRGAEEGIGALEIALDRLCRNMATGPEWTSGAVAVIRDAEDNIELLPLFDEDAANASLADLDVPGPPGHPLEGPEYKNRVASEEAGMAQIHAETSRRRGSWNGWSIGDDDRVLVLDHGNGVTRHKFQVLGTFHPDTGRYAWATNEPLFPDAVCEKESFSATLDAVMELGMLTTVRLGAQWLFLETYGEGDDIVLGAVWA